MAHKQKAELNLRNVLTGHTKRGFASMRQARTRPHKWVVKTLSEGPATEYVVVGLNHAGYQAKVGLRTADRALAKRSAYLLNQGLARATRS